MCRLHYSSSTLTRSFRNCPSAALIDQCENDYCITSRRGLCVRLEIASHTRALYFPTGRERRGRSIITSQLWDGRAFRSKGTRELSNVFFFFFFSLGGIKSFSFPNKFRLFLGRWICWDEQAISPSSLGGWGGSECKWGCMHRDVRSCHLQTSL